MVCVDGDRDLKGLVREPEVADADGYLRAWRWGRREARGDRHAGRRARERCERGTGSQAARAHGTIRGVPRGDGARRAKLHTAGGCLARRVRASCGPPARCYTTRPPSRRPRPSIARDRGTRVPCRTGMRRSSTDRGYSTARASRRPSVAYAGKISRRAQADPSRSDALRGTPSPRRSQGPPRAPSCAWRRPPSPR